MRLVKIEFKPAVLCMTSWAGWTEQRVEVIDETPKRYRIICPPDVQAVRLAGRHRYLRAGDTALVPKTAIQFK